MSSRADHANRVGQRHEAPGGAVGGLVEAVHLAARRGTRRPSRARPPGSSPRAASRRGSRRPSPRGSPRYQASGSRAMMSSAGFAVWAKKNQCHQLGGEAGVAALERLDDRHAVHHDEPRDVVRRPPAGARRSSRDRAPRRHTALPSARHQRRDRAAIARLVWPSSRSRLAVAGQVGADDLEAGVASSGATRVPGRVRARMPVQQHDRRPAAADAHAQPADPLEREAVEEHASAFTLLNFLKRQRAISSGNSSHCPPASAAAGGRRGSRRPRRPCPARARR